VPLAITFPQRLFIAISVGGIKFYEKTPMVVAQEKNLTWLALKKKGYEGTSGKRFFLELLGLKSYLSLSPCHSRTHVRASTLSLSFSLSL
jgi:hypothetical protein